MSRWGCVGLVSGSLLGLALLILLVPVFRPTIPAAAVPPLDVAPDLTLFLSERSVSRFASQALNQPTIVNFEPGGQVILTTQVNIGWLELVADLGLSLEMQGTEITSQVYWLQLGFLRIPARWLPSEITELGSQPGKHMTQQLPPQLTLVGLTTTPNGINLQFDLRGP